jgi:murein DD-endopeptidase MepM/ murein hydrolase activator NlpD
MLSSKRMRARGLLAPVAGSLTVALAVAAAGCSSDVTRFKLGSSSTTGSIPVPYEPVVGHASVTKGSTTGSLTEASLPPTDPPNYQPPPPNYQPVGRPPTPQPPPPTLGPAPKQPPPVADAGTIVVQPGDTLYNIARRHGVAPYAIKDANGLQSDTVRPGQRLVMPTGAHDGNAIAKAPPPRPEPKVDIAKVAPVPAHVPPAASPPGWEGRYVLKSGESLYGIAQQHKVTLEELKRVNGITDPTKVWTGTVLMVPARPDTIASPPPAAKGPPRIINAPEKIAKRSDIASDVSPVPDTTAIATAGKFRWPVRGGKMIVGFGKRPDGTHNDGINLAVPLGSDVIAAEAGKVAYAGNELKGYGNLILVRHGNGWVSAYAHVDQVLVRASDEVKKGQVIAKAGKTGSVDQPQLHFELRQGSRPVDPLPHLAGN